MQPLPPVHYKHILMVSPFSGEADICPADKPCALDMVVNGTVLQANMDNCFRIINALYPFTVEVSLDGERFISTDVTCCAVKIFGNGVQTFVFPVFRVWKKRMAAATTMAYVTFRAAVG